MAEVVLNTTIMFKRGLAEAWTRNNPILVKGEPGYELDTHKLKVGDGSTAWIDLPYIGEGNPISEEEIKKVVEAYLAEHPITIETDKTLSLSGVSADAAAVREKCLMIDNSYEIIFSAGDADPGDDI